MTIHHYTFGYDKNYAENYDNIFRKKRQEADDEESSEEEQEEVEDVIHTK